MLDGCKTIVTAVRPRPGPLALMEVGMSSRSLALVSALWLAGSLVGCKADPPAAPPPPAVSVAPVLQRDVAEWDEFSGRLEAVDQVEIRPRVSGYIRRLTFTEGREVRKGEVLFEIDPRPYQADLDRAQAQLEQARTAAELAQREVARAEKLVKVQAISREEFDSRTSAQANSVAAVRAAEAAVETAQLNLNWTSVRSPINGRVSRAEVTEGNLVQAGPPDATLLTTVVALDSMYLYFDSDEQTYLRYSGAAAAAGNRGWRDARLPVYLGLANETGFPHEGRLDFVDNRIDPASGTIRTRAIFANRDRRFTPGLFARVKLVGSKRDPHAAGARRRHRHRPGPQVRAASWARATAWSTARSRSGACPTVSASCGRESRPATRSSSMGSCGCGPGVKVTPTVVAMVPDSSTTRDSSAGQDTSVAAVAER